MAFTTEELVNFSFKGWLGVLGTGDRDTAPDNFAWYEEPFTNDIIVKPTQVWTELDSIPPANTLALAQTAAVNNPTIIQDFSSTAAALRLTPTPNEKVFFATTVFGDLTTRVRNWILPQLIPLTSGFGAQAGLASIGYQIRIWQGDPNSGGTEITTTQGQVGARTAWVMSFGAGAVKFASDESLITDPNDLYITGFVYIGDTVADIGSGGGNDPRLDTVQEADQNLVVANTTGDEANSGAVLTNAPLGFVKIEINGVGVSLGNGVKTLDCYFSGDGGATARSFSNLQLGDTLYWNGNIAGYDLATTDRVTFYYI